MQARNAAFDILRSLALRDTVLVSRTIRLWNKPTSRLLHYSASRPLRSANAPQQDLNLNHPAIEDKTLKSHKSSIPKPKIPLAGRKPDPKAAYEMTFTCKPCGTRSSHRVSKQGYHFGSVLISCPECKNRHIISDHLGIFTDDAMTIEDLMRGKGQLVKKGTLSEDGDVEFWEDGTSTRRVRDADKTDTLEAKGLAAP